MANRSAPWRTIVLLAGPAPHGGFVGDTDSRETVPAGGGRIAIPFAKNPLDPYGSYRGCVRMRAQSHPWPTRSEHAARSKSVASSDA
jgi:hypothetical protein